MDFLINIVNRMVNNGLDYCIVLGCYRKGWYRPYPFFQGKIFEIMEELDKVTVASPVKVGDVIVEKVCGTEANIIATKNM